MYPVYKDTYERGGGQDLPFGDIAERDRVISWSKDLSRSIDYLETRVDIDREKLGFYGASVGAFYGPILTGVDTRLKVSVLLGAGLFRWDPLPEVDPFHFASRNRTPTLMVNGKDDFYTPVETAQIPLFRALAAETADKRHVVLEGGHFPVRFQEAAKEILSWLDRYLGPVHPGNEQ
jgi:dipeptidyl aminopeptidase/acylaminoacyl peptidase